MNIFKSIGHIINASTNSVVTMLDALNTTTKAVHNVAYMAEDMTASMRAEMQEENAQSLAELKAKAQTND